MDKKYIGIAQTVVRTTDIETIANQICNELNCGDVVIQVVDDSKEYTYQVIKKTDSVLAFCYYDEEKSVVVEYEKVEGIWTYSETKTAEFGGGGIAFGKYYIFDGEGQVQIVDEIPDDYTGLAYWFGDDGLDIAYYEEGAFLNDTYITNVSIQVGEISFSQKATVWEVNKSLDDLAGWITTNFSKIKAGDKFYSSNDQTIAEIDSLTNDEIYLKTYWDQYIETYSYVYDDANEEWDFGSQQTIAIGGTKLYKHIVICTKGADTYKFEIIVANSEAITNETKMETACEQALKISDVLTETTPLAYRSVDGNFINLASVPTEYFDNGVEIGDMDSFTDTVSPL